MTEAPAPLDRLPPPVAEAMRQVLALRVPAQPLFEPNAYRNLRVTTTATKPAPVDAFVVTAFEGVAWPPYGEPIPLPAALSDDQRALAELVARLVDLPLHRFAIPQTAWARRRWLGIDPSGPVERDVSFVVNGAPHTAPLYRALRLLQNANDHAGAGALFAALPLGERVRASIELSLHAYRVAAPSGRGFDAIETTDGAWAPALADWAAAILDGPHGERGGANELGWEQGIWLFLGLVRAHEALGLTIAPRWERFLPTGWSTTGPLMRRCLEALAPERRGPAMARALDRLFPRDVLACALEHLPYVPALEVVDRALAAANDGVGNLGVLPRREAVAKVRAAVAGHPVLEAHVDQYVADLPPLVALRVRKTTEPGDLAELTPLQRAQLRATSGVGNAGLAEDAPETGELKYVTFDEIVDGDGVLVYETARFMEEDGIIFRAGTTEAVAYVCQYALDGPDELLESLHTALRR